MNMIVNRGRPRRIHRLIGCLVIASAIAIAATKTAAAQAGSVGGTIGKQEKSVSGGEDAVVSHPPKNQREGQSKRGLTTASAHPSSAPHPSEGACRSIVGVWTSWAANIYGKNDTRINSDGTIQHPASKGRWSCSGGEYVHVWEAFGAKGPYHLSPDGRRLVKTEDGSVSFSR